MDLGKFLRNQWDRVGAWLCVIGGAVALLAGYFGVSGTLDTGKQLPYVVSGGMGGLFLLGLGAMLWLSADLRDEWRKLDAIDRHLQETETLPASSQPDTTAPATNGAAADGTVRERSATLPDS